MRKIILVTTLAIGFAAPLHAAPKTCSATFYQGSNAALLTGRYLKMAKDNAAISWGARVIASIGPDYADWSRATDKTYRCVKRGKLHKCTARARPCKLLPKK